LREGFLIKCADCGSIIGFQVKEVESLAKSKYLLAIAQNLIICGKCSEKRRSVI